jgi:Glycosyl transferase family 2
MLSKTSIICLTPIKNESWILDRFLQCASVWADYIIVADQLSVDNSREIACRYPKVILIENNSASFNEPERQKLLIEAARKIPGKRLLIALDADEVLSANFLTSPEWQTVISAKPGTVINFQWANLRPDCKSYWNSSYHSLGFMDDGSQHLGKLIHSPRLPIPENAPVIILNDVRVLHYQYTDWERMKSKHRWYQCFERVNRPNRRAIDIYRQYHHMYAIPQHDILPLPERWISSYIEQGIDMTSVMRDELFWWDQQVLELFEKYDAHSFKREAIWDVDWSALAARQKRDGESYTYADPRNRFEKYIHGWLKKTQVQPSCLTTLVDKILASVGW